MFIYVDHTKLFYRSQDLNVIGLNTTQLPSRQSPQHPSKNIAEDYMAQQILQSTYIIDDLVLLFFTVEDVHHAEWQ